MDARPPNAMMLPMTIAPDNPVETFVTSSDRLYHVRSDDEMEMSKLVERDTSERQVDSIVPKIPHQQGHLNYHDG